MRLVHLTTSTFYGGPERQMLGLARAMPADVHTTFASFPEEGRCEAFLDEVRAHGFDAFTIAADFPHVRAAIRSLTALLRERTCDTLICHGYKAHILGRIAAKRIGIPVIAVSRGWTGETRKVKAYEWLDRRHLRFMDHVVCVSDGQAEKVRRLCRVPAQRMSVIRNSARLAAFETRDPTARERLLRFFPNDTAVSQVVLAAGRLSPEKGFGELIDAATTICKAFPNAGIVLFGEGFLRAELEQRVKELGLANRFVLPGFRKDLDSLIGAADLFVLPSFTEGLPNVALEASAAGVPVVATAVGGTPEVIADGITGFLVPPGEPAALATRINQLLGDPEQRTRLGLAGSARMRNEFTFAAQATAYLQLIHNLNDSFRNHPTTTPTSSQNGSRRGHVVKG